MKLFVTGACGQVGMELVRQAKALGWAVMPVGRAVLDITDALAVRAAISDFKPDAVINAAAYTAVDGAESDVDAAFAVNRDGVTNLATVCEACATPLVHYSTDYVFSGSKAGAYVESDPVAPLGVYGESKLAGEQAVAEHCSKYLVLRTSWVFSAYGSNFVKTMLRLGAEREELGVVADQVGKPTAASEIARLTLELLQTDLDHKWGLYHLAQPDVTSWHSFAEAIFDEARSQGVVLKVETVKSIGTEDYPTPAKRPSNSELNCECLESTFSVRIKPWRESLSEVIRELGHA